MISMDTTASYARPQDTRGEASAAIALGMAEVCKSFGVKTALNNINFSVPTGSLTVILGPAGAGKTTTLRIVAGLDTPDTGGIALHGVDAQGLEPKDRDISMIFDNLALYPNKTGFENIASPLAIRGLPQQEIKTRVSAMAETLHISHVLDRLPKTMSGGERQRVALGRALIRTRRLYLLDEPLSSLDAQLRIELRAELKRQQRERGYTFLMATPDFNEAMALADTVIMLREGRVVQVSTPQALYNAPVDRETALFVGSPQVNILRATASSDFATINMNGTVLQTPQHLLEISLPAGEFELGIRPEDLSLAVDMHAQFVGSLADVEPLGLKSVLTVETGAGGDTCRLRLLVDSAQARKLKIGQPLGINLPHPERLLAFDVQTGRSLLLP